MDYTQHFENKDVSIELNVRIGQLSPGSLLQDRVVFVTGVTLGIGLQIAKK